MLNTLLRLLALTVAVTPFLSAQEPIDVDTLIEEISTVDQKNAFSGYFYELEFVRHKRAALGSGKLVKRYEAILPSKIPQSRSYRHHLLQVHNSAKDVTFLNMIRDRNRIVKELERIENGTNSSETSDKAAKNSGYISLGANKYAVGRRRLMLDISALIRNSNFSEPRQLVANGRPAISVNFTPKGGQKLSKSLFYLGLIQGTILIDNTDKRIIEIHGYPVSMEASYKDLAMSEREKYRVLYYRQTKVREGFWFPKYAVLDFMGFPREFENVGVKIEFTFSNYRRFSVDIKSVEIDSKSGEQTTEGEADPGKTDKETQDPEFMR